MLNNRISLARGFLHRAGIDLLVVQNLFNIRYLAGFTGSDGALILGGDRSWFMTDSRYTLQASEEVRGSEVVQYRTKRDDLAALLREQGARRVGFESAYITVAGLVALKESLPDVEFVPVGDEFDSIRLIKDDEEQKLLQEAAAVASEAFLSIMPLVRPGAVERELAFELELAMRKRGAEDKSFDFIVASGTRGAMPHGRASEAVIGKGDLVTFDFGARYRGYHSDETVTVAVGGADARQRQIYSVVKEAHDRALAAVKPGVPLKDLDALARGYIEEKGFGSYFGHGLGHGIGLEVHEKPTVSFRGEDVAREGMVFTIEPGIYIPGWGGIRIEDTIVVTEKGCRTVTKVPKELLVV